MATPQRQEGLCRPGGETSTTGVSLFVFGIRYIDDIGAWASRPPSSFLHANASGPAVIPAQAGIQTPSLGSACREPGRRAGEGRDGGESALLLTCSPFSSLAASARYYLTDANYNVLMIVTDSGWGVERVFYTAYGEPEVFPFGDSDGDYLVDAADETLITAIKNGSQPYNILADLNLDGAVTQADLNAFGNYEGALGGRNVLTASKGSATTGNDIGYAGYTWNDERSQWHVRHREYDPKMGRFLQRDPVGHSSGSNFYQYADGSAATLTDAGGLSPFPPSVIPAWTLPNFTENGTDMASEPPPPTYWGMLLGPGFDPSWLNWGGNPFEGIFNPLIAPGFDPNQFCQQPAREYRADNMDNFDPLPPDGRKVGVGSYLGSRNYQAQYSDGINFDWCMATCLVPKLLALLPHVALQAIINAVPLLGTIVHSPIDPDAPLLEPGPSPVPNPGRKIKRVVRVFRNGAWRFVLRDADDYSHIWNPHWAELGQWGYKSYAPHYRDAVHGSVTTSLLGYRATQLTRLLNGAMRAAPLIGHLHLGVETLNAIEDAYNECVEKCGGARAM